LPEEKWGNGDDSGETSVDGEAGNRDTSSRECLDRSPLTSRLKAGWDGHTLATGITARDYG